MFLHTELLAFVLIQHKSKCMILKEHAYEQSACNDTITIVVYIVFVLLSVLTVLNMVQTHLVTYCVNVRTCMFVNMTVLNCCSLKFMFIMN